MARVTVEDCLENVKNRFELVMISSKRARQLAVEGKESKVPWENDKPTVVALREIAEGLVTVDILNPAETEDPDVLLLGDELSSLSSELGMENAFEASTPDADAEQAPDSSENKPE